VFTKIYYKICVIFRMAACFTYGGNWNTYIIEKTANNWHSWNCIEYHHDLVIVNQNTTIVVVTTSTKKERNWSFNTFSISLNFFYISQITSFVLLTLFNFNVKRYCVLPFLLLVNFPFLNRLFVKVVTIYWINQYGSTDIIYLWICCWLKKMNRIKITPSLASCYWYVTTWEIWRNHKT
jgi:hypothetical protein